MQEGLSYDTPERKHGLYLHGRLHSSTATAFFFFRLVVLNLGVVKLWFLFGDR